MVTITTKISLPDDKIAEAKADLETLTDPRHLMTFNDGYYAASLERKWRMSTSTLGDLVKEAGRQKREAEREARRRKAWFTPK